MASMARVKSPLRVSERPASALRAWSRTRRAAAKSRFRFPAGLAAFALMEAIHIPSFYAGVGRWPLIVAPANANFVPVWPIPPDRSSLGREHAANSARDFSSVGKKVGVFPAGQVELGSRRKEIEAGFGQSGSAFARQHSIQDLFQPVQKGNVIRRVG